MDDFPADVRRFILEHINSVDQLEMLLLLRDHPDKSWTAAEVARALYTQPEAAALRLEGLRARGLLTAKDGAERQYQFRPATSALEHAVRRLADTYKNRRVTVIGLIYSKPLDQVQAFADAFKLR